jgi:hypothetical protein
MRSEAGYSPGSGRSSSQPFARLRFACLRHRSGATRPDEVRNRLPEHDVPFFGNKSNKEADRAARVAEILQEACDRNTPVCVIRPAETGRVPMARGRLLGLNETTIDIDEVQVPGLNLEFRLHDDLDAYFSMNKTLFHFRTRLLASCEPKRLNHRMIIQGMTLARPGAIEEGDRRGLYRVSLGGLADRVGIEVWRLRAAQREMIDEGDGLEDDEDITGLPPVAFNLEGLDLSTVDADRKRQPDYGGWLIDGTETGFGLRLEYVRPERFSMFEPVLVKLRLPESNSAIRFLCEVRSKRPVSEDGTKLGVVVIPESDTRSGGEKTQAMRRFLTDVQRAQLQRSRTNSKKRSA